ncbi:MAG: sulfite exporter TauE/SafE family protein [Pseudolabrys sp.]
MHGAEIASSLSVHPMWPSFHVLLVAIPVLAGAYVIFGIAGFGTALVAAPILAHIMPVASIVPLLALLDCIAASSTGIRFSAHISRSELWRLVPLMIIGSVAGTYLLLLMPSQPMMTALGIFVISYAIYGLVAPAAQHRLSRAWVFMFGTFGGAFSAMFGSGGPIYAMYLSRRLEDKQVFQATQTTLIGFATLTRIVLFTIAGIYNDWHTPLLALCLLPGMLAGMWVGHHITLRLAREQFLRVLYAILLGSGTTLIVHAALAAAQ